MNSKLWQEDFEERLARAWPAFVNCNQRMLIEGSFLRDIFSLMVKPRILDAAAGMGCEATWLLQRGFDVTANEYSPIMRRMATENAAEHGITLHPYAYDWRVFDMSFERDSFNIVLLLGNSLCLMHKKADRVKVAQNLYNVCAPGGLLIIDERNFRYILNERSAILNGEFRYSCRVMYCGDEIIGRPTAISSRNVTFTYFERNGGIPVGRLDMYPFRQGEMRELFEEAGFRFNCLYSDLRRGEEDNVDFYTYVFMKA